MDGSRGKKYWFDVAVEVCSGGSYFRGNPPTTNHHLFPLPQAMTLLGLSLRTNNGQDVYPLPVQMKRCGRRVLAQKLCFDEIQGHHLCARQKQARDRGTVLDRVCKTNETPQIHIIVENRIKGGDQKVKAKSGWSVIPLSAPTPNRPLARGQFEHLSATSLLDAVAIGV